MEIHLPKPSHTWREFLSEIGVVVVGVLIALGAEQTVHAMQLRHEADEARKAIRGELEFNLARLRSRLETRACVERRIEEIQALLDRAADQPAIRTPAWVGRPQWWTMQTSRWQAVAQAGHAALIEPEELAAYGIMYAQMQNVGTELQAEQGDWARLRALEHLGSLTPQVRFELLATLQDARYRHWRINQQTGQLIDRSLASLRLRTVQNPLPATRAICLPIDTPRGEVARLSGSPYGEP